MCVYLDINLKPYNILTLIKSLTTPEFAYKMKKCIIALTFLHLNLRELKFRVSYKPCNMFTEFKDEKQEISSTHPKTVLRSTRTAEIAATPALNTVV